MISPTFATAIILSFLFIFGVILPILGTSKRFSDAISFRWMCVVVVLALMIGSVIDFSSLSSECRKVLLLGGIIVVGGYIVLRTIEKLFASGYIGKAPLNLKVSKGDIAAEVKIAVDGEEKKL